MTRSIPFERLEDLEAALSPVSAQLAVGQSGETGFRATVGRVNGLVVADIEGPPCSVRRDARSILPTDPDILKISLLRRGRAAVDQDGRQCRLRPGDLVAYDPSRPYELHALDNFRSTIVAIPRSRLGANAELISQQSACALPTGTGLRTLVSSCLSGLAANLDHASYAVGMHVAEALICCIVSAFADQPLWRADLDAELCDRIFAYCLSNLADPGLSVTSVADVHGISVRYVHKVMSRRGITMAAWIRRERMYRIHRDLSNPALAHRTNAQIAARWGILDPAHLGRALSAEFGQTAKQIRLAALDGR